MKIKLISALNLLLLTFFSSVVLADVSLPKLLSDGAVLQRDKPVTIWGWADEGEAVSVKFAGKEKSTKTKNGSWSVSFPALKAGGGEYELVVIGKNTLTRKNIVIGDVWIASGQSNMETTLLRVRYRYPDVLVSTHEPMIRSIVVPTIYGFNGPEKDYPDASWKQAFAENMAPFSAVGFFFMQSIYRQTHVPIGLISLPVGGSPVEAWMSEDALKKYPKYLDQLRPFKDDAFVQKTIAKDKAANDKWYSKLTAADQGLKNNWSAEKLDTQSWKNFQIPGFLQEQRIDFTNGSFWVRRNFSLSEDQAKKSATLWLGRIVDADEVFINGKSVGQVTYQYPPRIYPVPENILKSGVNTISVRVVSNSGNPGFVQDKPYELDLGDEKVALSGIWKFKIAAAAGPMEATTTLHYQPASLFNAKLAPTLPLKIKGVIWFQGESNVSRADEYQSLFTDMILDWRKQFKQGDFPFLYAQLANFLPTKDQPSESDWAALREAQRKTLSVKNTGMAVTLDLGDWNDIHPWSKKEVGERLALHAMKLAYGKKSIVTSGPLVKSAKLNKARKIEIQFDSAKGLVIRGDKIRNLAIASADKKFVWTTATVNEDKLIVDTDLVENPKWVRYAWADNPDHVNLYNAAGLPASSFEIEVK